MLQDKIEANRSRPRIPNETLRKSQGRECKIERRGARAQVNTTQD